MLPNLNLLSSKQRACSPDTPAIPRDEKHHELVHKGGELIIEEDKLIGGQLDGSSGARFRTYERLKRYAEETKARSLSLRNS